MKTKEPSISIYTCFFSLVHLLLLLLIFFFVYFPPFFILVVPYCRFLSLQQGP